jgi:hypothetical protein
MVNPVIAKAFRWLGEHISAAIVSFLVALLLAYLISILVHHSDTGKDGWPDGKSAWTVILASEQTRGQAESAVEQAKRVPSEGLSLGVLHSNDYASLRPGYWVAFAGQFDSATDAQRAAERYRRQFPTTYQRFIEEK